jgi:ABC-type iron transport system FetAB permease component
MTPIKVINVQPAFKINKKVAIADSRAVIRDLVILFAPLAVVFSHELEV